MTNRSLRSPNYFFSLGLMGKRQNRAFINNVVARIKGLREDHGLTLEAFYHDTGIHLARIESQKRDISIGTMKRICDYFGVSVSELLRGL